MTLPLVTQLRFARREFVRCLDGVTPEEAVQRFMPINSIGWIIGHLASQEQYLWVYTGQNKVIDHDLYKLVGFGRPATTPDQYAMWNTWNQITQAADDFLDQLTPEMLDVKPANEERQFDESYGTLLLRNIYHYWFHTGEAHAIRQMLGHPDLPQFVGDMENVSYQ